MEWILFNILMCKGDRHQLTHGWHVDIRFSLSVLITGICSKHCLISATYITRDLQIGTRAPYNGKFQVVQFSWVSYYLRNKHDYTIHTYKHTYIQCIVGMIAHVQKIGLSRKFPAIRYYLKKYEYSKYEAKTCFILTCYDGRKRLHLPYLELENHTYP